MLCFLLHFFLSLLFPPVAARTGIRSVWWASWLLISVPSTQPRTQFLRREATVRSIKWF